VSHRPPLYRLWQTALIELFDEPPQRALTVGRNENRREVREWVKDVKANKNGVGAEPPRATK
jgi:hypothetical protein